MHDLERQQSDFAEVIVIDGDSPDGTAKYISEHYSWVKCISYGRGVSIQRNYGASLASSKLLIFLDADVRVSSGSIQTMVHKFYQKNLAIACPIYIPITKKLWIHALFGFLNATFFVLQKLLPSGAGPCLIIDKELFCANGGFTIVPFEDMELIRRIAKRSKYAIMNTKVYVSDRRMRKDGFLKTIVMYIFLCVAFTFGNFQAAEKIKYRFWRASLEKCILHVDNNI